MNELKNVHYTGTELLWLESGFPHQPGRKVGPIAWRIYNEAIEQALSKAVCFEDQKKVASILLIRNHPIKPGESYYLDPKLVELHSECSCMIRRPQFCFAPCDDQTVVARIVEPKEQKESQDGDYELLATRLHRGIRATDQEYIICAAIHFESNKVQAHQPKNITHGLVVCGRRHHNCFATIYTFDVKLKEIEQGFITSKDRFVNRKEAGEIAFKAGQTKELRTCLFSEDIY